jgi:hypothetical protein
MIKLSDLLNEDATSAPQAPTAGQATAAAPKQTADVQNLTKLVSSNTTLLNRLKTINNGKEVTEFITFILNNINDKTSGVNKTAIKSIIDQRFK